MSTKSHFIYEDGIEGYEETIEPKQTIFGEFSGYNSYLIIEPHILKSFKINDGHIIIETKNTTHLPQKFQIWGDAILDIDWDIDGLCIKLEGGHYVTKKIIAGDYTI